MVCPNPHCRRHVICRSIRKKGKVIYPKRAPFFSFCIENTDPKEKAAKRQTKAA